MGSLRAGTVAAEHLHDWDVPSLSSSKADGLKVATPTLPVDNSFFFHLQKIFSDLFW